MSSKGQGVNEVNKDKKQAGKQTTLRRVSNNQHHLTSKEFMKVKGLVREKKSKKPLIGARVKIQGNVGELELVTDKEGIFEFEMPTNETISITAALKGYTQVKLMYHRGKEAVLELGKCGTITGTITHQGFSVAGSKVTLFNEEISGPLNQTESNSKGEFAIFDLIPTVEMEKMPIEEVTPLSFVAICPYELKIEHPDYCTLWIRGIEVKEGETLFYKIELLGSGLIEGSIYDEFGKLIDGTTVRIWTIDCDHLTKESFEHSDMPSNYSLVKGCDANNGKFLLKLPQGCYHIIADPISSNFIPYQSDCIRLITGERITRDIYLKTGKTITGIVTDETLKPLSDVWVMITSDEGNLIPSSEGTWSGGDLSTMASYHTKGDGRFAFHGLSNGLYTIRARDQNDDYKIADLNNISAGTSDIRIILKKKSSEDRDADVELKIMTLTGKVSKFTNVHFINEAWSQSTLKYRGGLGQEGLFKKEDYVPEGRYTLLVSDKSQNLYGIIHTQYITRSQKNFISIVLDKKGAKIRGRVLNSIFRSIMIKVFIDTEKRRNFFENIKLDNKGDFEISGLPPCYVEIDFKGDESNNLKFELQPYEIKDLGTIDLKK